MIKLQDGDKTTIIDSEMLLLEILMALPPVVRQQIMQKVAHNADQGVGPAYNVNISRIVTDVNGPQPS